MIKERSSFTIGEEVILTKLVNDDDIKAFAKISGDDNPVHVNDEYARDTMFAAE